MRFFVILLFLILSSCADEALKVDNTPNIPEITDDIIDEVNNEQVVIYEIYKSENVIDVVKNNIYENITFSFKNPRNEEVHILIPETMENKNNNIYLDLQNPENSKCRAQEICSITFSFILREQNSITGSDSFYVPVTLSNDYELEKFININSIEKYKETAMKYINNRIYIKYLQNITVK